MRRARDRHLLFSAVPFAAAVLLITLCVVAALAEDQRSYVGARKCKICHGKELMGDQHTTWKAGPHGKAYRSLLTESAKTIASRTGLSSPPESALACLRCHTTASAVPESRRAYALAVEDGIQCESCHGPGADYRKKKVMSDLDRAKAAGLWDAGGDAALCTTCHNDESPTFDPNRYLLPDGSRAGFDFEQALKRISHPIPEEVKGRYIELERKQKEEQRREREAGGR
jgi:hypothetical protein